MDERAIGGWGQLYNKNEVVEEEFELDIPYFLTSDYQNREAARNLCLMAYDAEHRHYKSNSHKIEEARTRKSNGQFLLLLIAVAILFMIVCYVESPAFDLLFH